MRAPSALSELLRVFLWRIGSHKLAVVQADNKRAVFAEHAKTALFDSQIYALEALRSMQWAHNPQSMVRVHAGVPTWNLSTVVNALAF